jgi:DNA-binding GntR family transcriptional regulator
VKRFDIRPVVKMPVEVQAANALRESIVTGLIAPGTRLIEIALSQEMKLSRATVRAALHQLAAEGLIGLVSYTGWTVVPLTANDVWELYTLRSGLERIAGQLAARSRRTEKTEILGQAFDSLVRECGRGDPTRIAEADFALHKTIIQLIGHRRLESQYRLLEQQIRMYIRSSDALVGKPAIIVDQHRPIVKAILAGDVEKAGRLSEEHNLSEGKKLSDHLKELEAERTVASKIRKPGRTVMSGRRRSK